MRSKEAFVGKTFTDNLEAWLRREDTWLAQGLRRVNPLEGAEYRISTGKRVVDLSIAAPAAIISSAPAGVILLASSLQKPPGNPFYRQERRKTRDSNVEITKFRTMRMGSDQQPDDALKFSGEYSPEEDPRNTRLGKILRAFELDELPQLFEILLGKLSLVDIRSMAEKDFLVVEGHKPKTYKEWGSAYFGGTPGAFSLNTAMNEDRKHVLKRQHYDLFYARHASLGLDLFILFKTGLRMFRKAEQKIRRLKGKQII